MLGLSEDYYAIDPSRAETNGSLASSSFLNWTNDLDFVRFRKALPPFVPELLTGAECSRSEAKSDAEKLSIIFSYVLALSGSDAHALLSSYPIYGIKL